MLSYNDQWQLLTEVKDGSPYAIYQWHPFYIDALAVRMRASDTHFFLHDANYNVTAAVDDSTNAVVERYNYTPYGEVTVLNADFSLDSSGGGDGISDIDNTHLYTGRERDPETGLQLNRHRYYASHLGRWLTQDPIGYGGGENLYAYVSGMPTFYLDFDGLEESTPLPPDDDDKLTDIEKEQEGRRKKRRPRKDDPSNEWDGSKKRPKDTSLEDTSKSKQRARTNRRRPPMRRGPTAGKVAKKVGKKCCKKLIGPAFIAIDLYTGGPAYACNEVLWPLSEFWRDDGMFDEGPE